MCILCNKTYEEISQVIKSGFTGLSIRNCDVIEEVTIPSLENLSFYNCPNLRKITIGRVAEDIVLCKLPNLVTIEVVDARDCYCHKLVANNCPKFIAPKTMFFDTIVYQDGCLSAFEKYFPGAECVMIEAMGERYQITVTIIKKDRGNAWTFHNKLMVDVI